MSTLGKLYRNVRGNRRFDVRERSENAPKRNVLDHGFVRLVDHMGGDLSVVRAARVSYNAAWRAPAICGRAANSRARSRAGLSRHLGA